jgi:hypothetical protein
MLCEIGKPRYFETWMVMQIQRTLILILVM